MDSPAEVAKIQKALREVEQLMLTAGADRADELERLHSFFLLALSQVPESLSLSIETNVHSQE